MREENTVKANQQGVTIMLPTGTAGVSPAVVEGHSVPVSVLLRRVNPLLEAGETPAVPVLTRLIGKLSGS